jgi:hypothetical protein
MPGKPRFFLPASPFILFNEALAEILCSLNPVSILLYAIAGLSLSGLIAFHSTL